MAEPQVRTVRFNELPRSTRERFIFATTEPKKATDRPIRSETVSPIGRIIGWGFLGLMGAGMVMGLWNANFGSLWRDGIQKATYLPWYALGLFVVIISIAAAVYRHLLSKSLPYKEGRYLFPFDLITTDKDKLIITPMSLLKGVRIVEHYRNGAYQYTAFHMDFSNGKTETFSMGKKDPDAVKSALDGARAEMRKALEAGDMKAIEQLDLLFAAEQAGWKPAEEKLDLVSLGGDGTAKAQTLPDYWRHRLLGSVAIAVVLSPVVWAVRNVASDNEMWRRAQARGNVEAIEDYLRYGSRHIKEAKEQIYPVAFEEASKKKSASALREMIRKYPESPFVPKAREAIHALIEASWQKFKARAGENADPKMLGFMQRLLAYLEKNDTSTVTVKFQPPDTEAMTKIDSELTKKNIAPVSAHFSPRSSSARETIVLNALSRGFGSVFPNDILRLKRPGDTDDGDESPATRWRSRLNKTKTAEAAPAPKVELPVMDIRYSVEPTSDVFKGKTSQRAFVGIQVGFDLKLSIPGDPEPLPIVLTVLPPERFTVSYTTRSKYAGSEGPSDSLVYSVMAERAFDQFASKLAQIFFNETPREPLAPPPPPRFTPSAPLPPPAAPPAGKKKRGK